MNFDFTSLLYQFTGAVEAGDGRALSDLFTLDGVYDDTFYGVFVGRAAIIDMLENRFWSDAEAFQWDMCEPVFDSGRDLGYSRWVFSYSSTMKGSSGKRVVFSGMSQFSLRDGLIVSYREVFSAGLALVQLEMAPARIDKILQRLLEKHKKDPEWGQHLRFGEK